MIATLRESKARLSALVESASQGQDVLITVRGKVKARLTRAAKSGPAAEKPAWVRQLRALHKAYSVSPPGTSVERILAEIREDRV
jgi:prevent-host-death family protein